MLTVGFLLDNVPDDFKATAYNIHKLVGLSVLLLMILRLCWALANPKPHLPNTALWERFAERFVHFALYFLVILMPLAGWIGSSAAGRYPHIGDFLIKFPVAEDKGIKELAFNIHGIAAYLLIGFITIHVLAALYHYFIKRDNVLQRML